MNHTKYPIETTFLEWDSAFFGRPVFQTEIANLDMQSLQKVSANVLRQVSGEALVYLRIRSGSPQTTQLPNAYEAYEVDHKLFFSRDLNANEKCCLHQSGLSNVKFCRWDSPSPSDDMISLAHQAGHMSRFRRDPRIDNSIADKLYELWIKNSVTRDLPSETFVAKAEDDRVLAMGTVGLSGDIATIGLLAVNPNYRGLGLGSAILKSITNWSRDRKAVKILVATQAENESACWVYRKNNFMLERHELIYHLWINSDTGKCST